MFRSIHARKTTNKRIESDQIAWIRRGCPTRCPRAFELDLTRPFHRRLREPDDSPMRARTSASLGGTEPAAAFSRQRYLRARGLCQLRTTSPVLELELAASVAGAAAGAGVADERRVAVLGSSETRAIRNSVGLRT